MSKALTLNEILALDDLPVQAVEVPQWNGHVLLRTLRADERAELERKFSKRKPSEDPLGFRKALIQATAMTPDGASLVANEEQAAALMAKNSEAVETIFEKALEINGFRKKDITELEKNSEASQP